MTGLTLRHITIQYCTARTPCYLAFLGFCSTNNIVRLQRVASEFAIVVVDELSTKLHSWRCWAELAEQPSIALATIIKTGRMPSYATSLNDFVSPFCVVGRNDQKTNRGLASGVHSKPLDLRSHSSHGRPKGYPPTKITLSTVPRLTEIIWKNRSGRLCWRLLFSRKGITLPRGDAVKLVSL